MILNKQIKRWAGRSLIFGLSAPFALAQPSATSELPTVHFDVAMQHLENCQWPQAFERFAALADAGHDQAARIALLMQAHGTRLFGGRFTADASRRERWLDTAAAQSPVTFAAALRPDL